MNEFIPQMRPFFGLEEREEIISYLDEDGFFTEFKRTEKFEQEIASFTGAKHCIVVNNGTISLSLAALALGVGPGDDVIVPNYTMIATPNSLKLIGANPVFVDVNPNTLILDETKIASAITSKTKAIFLVTANGRAPDCGIENFLEIANRFSLPVIEDAAQSLGSYYEDGTHIGLKGRVGSISFSAPKIISTGQGGAMITNDTEIANKLRKFKDFGRESGGNDIHDVIGWNFKFTELQACVGLAQMRKLPERIKRKQEIYKKYKAELSGLDGLKLFENNTKYCAPWFIDSMAKDRDNLIQYLKSKNIGTRLMYPPINVQKAYGVTGSFPVSEAVGREGLWLPSMVQITDDQIMHVCNSIREYYKSNV
jgi:perosamine synthetase